MQPETSEIGNVDAAATTESETRDHLDGAPAVEQPALDEEILSLLGETPTKDKKYGAEIQNDLAVRWEHIATSGLSKEARKELLEKHMVPNNCKKVEAPALNPEIKAALTDALLKKDKALETKQKQQAAAISCLSEALTLILASEHKDPKIIKLLIEAGRIMCDSQHTESLTRRSFICSTIKKELKDQLYDTEIDKFLFGEKLADTLKAAKAINKSATDMKATAPRPSQNQKKAAPKNSKFPQYNRLQSTVSHATPNPPPAAAPAPQATRKLPRPPPPPPRSSRPRAPAPRR